MVATSYAVGSFVLGIIHRDLAARNCLLDTQLVVDGQVAVMVKVCGEWRMFLPPFFIIFTYTPSPTLQICDFGQALRVRNAAVAKRTPLDAEPLPWRWLAPECLPDTNLSGEAHWSLYSDVWSFGIVLWEMISHGETPYHDLDLGGESYQDFVMRNSSHARLAQWLHQGRRLNMPSSCPPAYAAVVRSCWALGGWVVAKVVYRETDRRTISTTIIPLPALHSP